MSHFALCTAVKRGACLSSCVCVYVRMCVCIKMCVCVKVCVCIRARASVRERARECVSVRVPHLSLVLGGARALVHVRGGEARGVLQRGRLSPRTSLRAGTLRA